ncbi:MAG TPA: GNAT family N-acetyltransferase, partial [Anaerolineae bacterium]|nr:GNAT family N-acetyltransferase [Anaerolineae bacterium]
MLVADLDAVMAIEALSLPLPEPRMVHERELASRVAHYLVLAGADGAVLGYGGLWVQVDDLHVIVMAVHPAWRRRGLGARILRALIRRGMDLGCLQATLEVRAGNLPAQA